MVDPVGTVKGLIALAAIIKTTADTVRHNKEACVELRDTVEILHACVAPLEDMDMSAKPGMRAALRKLEGTLRNCHDLVIACQKERNFVYILFTAAWRSRKLLKVNDAITTQMLLANFALNANTAHIVTIALDRPSQSSRHPPHQEGTGEYHEINYVRVQIVAENDGAPMLASLKIFNSNELESATDNYSEENVIGKAGSATVYKGSLLEEHVVTIKRYSYEPKTQRIDQYIHIFRLLLGHENIVKFLGYCHEDGREILVEEYMPNGSLFDIINGSSLKMDWPSTLRVIRGVAHGVAYMHSRHVIHLDLNPANILFDYDMNPKITNFERSIQLDKNVVQAVSHELVGTMGYMSPEYITDGIISMSNDVFSFGVLLLHSISGMRSSALDQHPITWAWEVHEAKGMNGLLDSSWGNNNQLEEMKRCMEIGLLCTQELKKDRPIMSDVVELLNGSDMLCSPKKPSFI